MKLDLPIGAHVLIGRAGVSQPSDWWLATILWTDGEDVLVRQGGIAGSYPHNQIHPVDYIRALGDIAFLSDFRRKAVQQVEELERVVRETESALGAARAAVWRRLDEIGATVPGVEAPTTRASRRRRQKVGVYG